MKQTITLLAFIIAAFNAVAQTDATGKTKDYYLTKSRHQKTIAWIMAGGGAALTGLGLAIEQSNTINDALGSSHSNSAGAVIAVAGAASVIGSIPFFISAAHNKKEAASLSASIYEIPSIYAAHTNIIFQPSITFKIAL